MLWLVIGLIFVGLLALIIEIFVPAGGLIGIAGLGCYIAGIVLTFRNFNPTTGFITIAVSIVAAPVFFFLAFRIFPKTYMGKRLILKESQLSSSGYTSYTSERYADLKDREGVALTMLRPSGVIRIGEKKYSVVTGGEYIEPGDSVRVSLVEGSRIVVRKIKESERKESRS
jgi:membrane-bound serine protease (ClpP class)